MFFACERLGIAASQCLYVGDHVRDIEGWPQCRHAYRGGWLGLSQ